MNENTEEIQALASDYEDRGAIPTLDSENALGAPTANNKKKSSVTKFFLLTVITAGLLFILFGFFLYSKAHQKKLEESGAVATIKETAAFLEKNDVVGSDDIEKTKANLKTQEAEKAKAEEEAALQASESEDQTKAKEDADKQALELEQAKAEEAAAKKQTNAGTNQTASNNSQPSQPAPHIETPKERRQDGSVLFDLADKDANKQIATSTNQTKENDTYQRVAFNGQDSNGNSIASRLNPTVLQARKAGKLPNLKYLLKQGTQIPCALQTGINTTLPGFILCVTTSDVYSADKKTLLVERGSQIMGEQQANIKQGEARVFALWTRIDTPEGVSINIDSPAADQMGYTGIPAFVDNHFWDRFGNAILISMIKDVSTIAIERARQSDTSSSLNINNSQQVGNQMATEALRNSINIPPTGVVNPATLVEVFVARDISFENIYTTLE